MFFSVGVHIVILFIRRESKDYRLSLYQSSTVPVIAFVGLISIELTSAALPVILPHVSTLAFVLPIEPTPAILFMLLLVLYFAHMTKSHVNISSAVAPVSYILQAA